MRQNRVNKEIINLFIKNRQETLLKSNIQKLKQNSCQLDLLNLDNPYWNQIIFY